jgi:hypothetical protein
MNASVLLQLPREIIYKIAAEDASVYNVILRLCRATAALFPLSLRLDFMKTFGVRVMITNDQIQWIWNFQPHDVFGPAQVYDNTEITYYYRGARHRIDKPACVECGSIQWYVHGKLHRDPAAPSGTGVDWLTGITSIIIDESFAILMWCYQGEHVRNATIYLEGSTEYEQARAEIDWWLAQERQ